MLHVRVNPVHPEVHALLAPQIPPALCISSIHNFRYISWSFDAMLKNYTDHMEAEHYRASRV
jgi:hypothetical protein